MTDIDLDYHRKLEETIDHLLNLWLEPMDDEIEKEDYEQAEHRCRQTMHGISLNLTPHAQEIIILAYTKTIAGYRKKIRQEAIIGRTSMLENRKLRSKLREHNIDF